MSVQSQIHAKPYAEAVKAAEQLSKMPQVTEEVKKAYADALASHPGNPANAKPAAKVYKTKDEVLAALQTGEIDIPTASTLLGAFEPKPVARQSNVYCKVSGKGAISLYGYQRMPVTLYAEQWERLLGDGKGSPDAKMILDFIAANEGKEFEVDEYNAEGKKTGRKIKTQISRKADKAAANAA
jgi:hypothetical protein